MALRISPDIYNTGVVELDSSPYVNFALNTMAQRKAHEDSIEEYYKKLPGTVNDAGMRDNERGKLNQMMSEAQKYWATNKDKLRNPKLDNGKSQVELENMYRQMNQLVNESKSRGKTSLEIGKMRFDPEKAYIFEDPNIIEALDKHDKAVGDEGSQSLNLSTMLVPPKPFEIDKHLKKFEKIEKDVEKTVGITHDPSTMKMTTEKEKSYSPSKLQAIYESAASEYSSNSSFRKFVKDTLDNEQKLKELDPIFRKYFKNGSTDARDGIRDWNDLAAVFTLQALSPITNSKKEEDDDRAKMDYQLQNAKALKAIDFEYGKKLAQFRKSIGGDGEGGQKDSVWVDSFLTGLEENGKRNLYAIGDYKGDGKEINMDPVLSKALSIGSGASIQIPDKLIVTQDGAYLPVFYQRDDDGNVIEDGGYPKVNKTLSKPISKQQMKLALGVKTVSATQRSKEMNQKTKSGSKTKDNPLGLDL